MQRVDLRGLTPWDLWGQGTGSMPVSGESHYEQQLLTVLGGMPPASGRTLDVEAILVPDPANRFDPNAVMVVVDQLQVGFIPAEHCASYRTVLAHLSTHGRLARVRGQVRGYRFTDWDSRGRQASRLGASVTLRLAEPHLVMPLTEPPTASAVELPGGRRQKVALHADATERLAPYLRPLGSGWIHATVHRVVETVGRTSRDVIGVSVDGTEVGRLTPAMSKNFLPLVDLLDDRALIGVAQGLLSGNQVQCELSLAAAKGSEITQGWLERHVFSVPPVAPPAQGPAQSPARPSIDASTGAQQIDDSPRSAGFYPDPEGVADLRFWDGSAWTSRIRMRPR